MKFLSRLFSKSPADLLVKGDSFLDSERFFDARTCYEDGLLRCRDDDSQGSQAKIFRERIDLANLKLAEINLTEAGFAFARGDSEKAIEHIELAKILTDHPGIQEQVAKMLAEHPDSPDDSAESSNSSSCGSCSHIQVDDHPGSQYDEGSLHPLEYFELLVSQLPEEQRQRYSKLGEDFAYAYVAACEDRHAEALALFEKCDPSESERDIYCCERGKILHRLGNEPEAEEQLREAIRINALNSLASLNLALLLIESGRMEEAMLTLDSMISGNMMAEQAKLMRGEILELTGRLDDAITEYSSLLATQYARSAAEKLHPLLVKAGRNNDAAQVFKRFLAKCGH